MPKNTTPPAPRDYFRATGQELREWAGEADALAIAEVDRRKAKRAAKAEAKAAA